MIWNLIKMLSGVITPIGAILAVIVAGAAFAGAAVLVFRCPLLSPVLAVVLFLLFCWLDNWNKRRGG